MALEAYTSTYTDVAESIIDADDLYNEFERIEQYLGAWLASYDQIGINTITYVDRVDEIRPKIYPLGLVQQIIVSSDMARIDIEFKARTEGNPYRVYNVFRFESKDTIFTVNGPSGRGHVFGRNTRLHKPSQVLASGYYTAIVIATYAQSGSVFLKVFADNDEASAVGTDDVLTARAF